jgi:hypothetical protein
MTGSARRTPQAPLGARTGSKPHCRLREPSRPESQPFESNGMPARKPPALGRDDGGIRERRRSRGYVCHASDIGASIGISANAIGLATICAPVHRARCKSLALQLVANDWQDGRCRSTCASVRERLRSRAQNTLRRTEIGENDEASDRLSRFAGEPLTTQLCASRPKN